MAMAFSMRRKSISDPIERGWLRWGPSNMLHPNLKPRQHWER